MDISKASCPNCSQSMQLTRATCIECDVSLEGTFEVSPLARLSEADQIFVIAFLRHHGSIRKMEKLFEISYPTVKNRLRALVAEIDKVFAGPDAQPAPTDNTLVLEQLARDTSPLDPRFESRQPALRSSIDVRYSTIAIDYDDASWQRVENPCDSLLE